MSGYNTKQRRLLIEYLSQHTDEALSAKQIASALEHNNVSLSAVYRNLTALEKSGVVKKSTLSSGREACYQYIDNDKCKGHLHLSCQKCGKIFHLNIKDSDVFVKSLAENEMFAVDKASTVVYGTCNDCVNKG